MPLAPEPFLAAEHASQAPEHGLSQHTPSTQLPLVQSSPVVQAFDVQGVAGYIAHPPEPSQKPF